MLVTKALYRQVLARVAHERAPLFAFSSGEKYKFSLRDDFTDSHGNDVDSRISLRRLQEEEDEEKRKSVEKELTNPFFNQRACDIKNDLKIKQDTMKEWHSDFRQKEGRNPSLREMKEDPKMAQLLENLSDRKRELNAVIHRFRIN